MSNQDDYELIQAEQADPAQARRHPPLMWVILGVALVIFGFTVGLAGVRLLTRLRAEPEADRVVATETPAATTAALVAMSTATPTTTATPTPTEQGATPTPSPTATIAQTAPCTDPVDPSFPPLAAQSDLGCPLAPPGPLVWAAWEPFERGSMFWRSDTDQAYAFTDGGWLPVTARWNGEPLAPRGDPPPGRYEPQRGFGFVWGADDALFQALGWATDVEKGFCARVQDFERGFVVQSSDAPSCTPDGLYNQATAADWQPLLLVAAEANRLDLAFADPPSTAEVPATDARPARHGSLFAPRANAVLQLDGNLSEWPNSWQPLNALVHGGNDYAGAADLQGVFQGAWSDEGLLLAVRVNDDRYRPGPAGTDMWQGDGLEIQFDRRLGDDYADENVNEDDYQIGVSFGSDLAGVRGYRWLPYAQEGQVTLPAGVRTLEQDGAYRGYNLELLIPWPLLGLTPQEPTPGARYGFNLSINDNDDALAAQQTTLSLSPARTTHDNPTEWATLVLTP